MGYALDLIKQFAKTPLSVLSGEGLFCLIQGPRSFYEYIQNTKKIWDPGLKGPSNPRSSISDNLPYPEFCELAANDPRAFARFKSALPYKSVLEHTGLKNGLFYSTDLQLLELDVGQEFLDFHSKLGNPETYTFRSFGRISPSLLRYMKVSKDFDQFFPTWKNMDILEVGIGYGGQLCVLKERGHSAKYVGVDLVGPIKLSMRYFDSSRLRTDQIVLMDGDKVQESVEATLFISNYAFCELEPEIQNRYFELFVSKCTHGYVTWNTMSETTLGGMTALEFAERVGGEIILDPLPTYADNRIIIWAPKL